MIYKMEQFEELKKVIKRLNSKDENEDASLFNFKAEIIDNVLRVVDCNEEYNVYYLETLNHLMYNSCEEFGIKFKKIEIDEIKEKLDNALKKDLNSQDVFFDWEDTITLVIGL